MKLPPLLRILRLAQTTLLVYMPETWHLWWISHELVMESYRSRSVYFTSRSQTTASSFVHYFSLRIGLSRNTFYNWRCTPSCPFQPPLFLNPFHQARAAGSPVTSVTPTLNRGFLIQHSTVHAVLSSFWNYTRNMGAS